VPLCLSPCGIISTVVFVVLMVIAGLSPFGIWLANSQDWDVAQKVFTWTLWASIIALPVCGLVAVLFPGHDISSRDAKQAFSREFFCPEERIDARRRTDVNVWDITHGADEPPAELKADPARVALWKQQQRNRRHGNRGPVFQMSGCGNDVLYECFHPQQTFGGTVAISSSVACDTIDVPGPHKPAAPRSERSPADGADGSLPKETVQAILDANRAQLAPCTNQIAGMGQMDVTIKPNGAAALDQPDDAGPEGFVTTCFAKAVSGIQFPSSRAATHFMMSYLSNFGSNFSATAVYQ